MTEPNVKIAESTALPDAIEALLAEADYRSLRRRPGEPLDISRKTISDLRAAFLAEKKGN